MIGPEVWAGVKLYLWRFETLLFMMVLGYTIRDRPNLFLNECIQTLCRQSVCLDPETWTFHALVEALAHPLFNFVQDSHSQRLNWQHVLGTWNLLKERNNWIFLKHEKDLLYNVLLINSYPLPTVIAINVNANKLTVQKVLLFPNVWRCLYALKDCYLQRLTWTYMEQCQLTKHLSWQNKYIKTRH